MYFTSLICDFGAAAAAQTGWLRIPQRLLVAAAISSRWPLEARLHAQDRDGSRAATRGCWSPQGAGAEKVWEKGPPAIASPGGPRARRSSRCSRTQRGGCEVSGWRLSGKWEKMSRGGTRSWSWGRRWVWGGQKVVLGQEASHNAWGGRRGAQSARRCHCIGASSSLVSPSLHL